MLATITNTTAGTVPLPLFNVVLGPFEVFQIRRSTSFLNGLLTGPRGELFQNFAASGVVTALFTLEPSDLYIPAPGGGGGVVSLTAGDGLLGGTITTIGTISFDFSVLGSLPAEGGPYAFPLGTPLAQTASGLQPADASVPALMPCVGLYTGASDRVRNSGLLSGLVGLPANAKLYVAEGGGLTATPPATPGSVVQYIGRSVGTTEVSVTLMTPVFL